ncbi:hypothetical protein [Tsuneonella mangrovi]|uniref:hypothetical protein n=1 Tax=Tsuneonella mangrovi TaxID=1982042 RepID=UPI001471CBAA|nr:hypothetical protein [Tsuneonella mangrovi]
MHVSYGTWNGGQSWQSLQDADGTGNDMKRVIDVDFSRQDPDFGMAIDWNGWAYITHDRGRSWTKAAELTPGAQELGYNPYDPTAFAKGWYDEQLGTRLSAIAVDPTNDRTWYIGPGNFFDVKGNHRSRAHPAGEPVAYADYGYILKSTDGGKSWHKIDEGLPKDLDVGKIIVDRSDPAHVALLSNHGVLLSSDGGLTWDGNVAGLPSNLPRDLVSSTDPTTGRTILFLVDQTVFESKGRTVRSKGGVFRSNDFGRTWSSVTGDLAFDLANIHYPLEVARYYRTIGYWFGITADAARTSWPDLPHSILPVFNRIAVNPRNPEEIYVTYNKKHDYTFGPGDVWRTLDGGHHWEVVARYGKYWRSGRDNRFWRKRNNPVGANVTFSHLQSILDSGAGLSGNRLLEIGPTGDVYISIDQQTLRSRDRGRSWRQIDDDALGNSVWIGRGDSDLPGREMLLNTGAPNRRLFASGEHGIWETVPPPAGRSLGEVPVRQIEGQVHGDGMTSISTMAVAPGNPDSIYALSWRQDHAGRLRHTTDGGRSWRDIATIFEPLSLQRMSKRERLRVQALASSGKGPPGLLPAQNSLTIDQQDPRFMYFVSTRDAASEVYRGPRMASAKAGFGFYRSSDGGRHWKLTGAGFREGASLRRLIADPDHPRILYIAANDDNGGLYKSMDRGTTWHKVPLPGTIRAVNCVSIDRHSHAIYVATGRYYAGGMDAGGVWTSADDGATWNRIFAAPLVTQIATSPIDPDILLVTVTSQLTLKRRFMNPGLFLSLDRGKSWRKINLGLANHDQIVDAQPDPFNRNVLWAAGWGSGWYVGYIGDQEAKGWLPSGG